jgi:hypothetical protein
MAQKSRSIVLILIGFIAIGLAIKCYTMDGIYFELRSVADTANTSKDILELARIVQFGFGSVLVVMGLALVGLGVTRNQ